MGYGIVLTMDPERDARFRALWHALAEAHITSIMLTLEEPPHLTLGILTELPSDFVSRLEALAAHLRPIESNLSAVGVFPGPNGVVYIAPTVTTAMLALHRHLHEMLAEINAASQGYHPDTWVPHCTVAVDLDPEQLRATVELCLQSDVFGPVRFEAIELFEFFPVRPICRLPLISD